jgi:hypothetical protein
VCLETLCFHYESSVISVSKVNGFGFNGQILFCLSMQYGTASCTTMIFAISVPYVSTPFLSATGLTSAQFSCSYSTSGIIHAEFFVMTIQNFTLLNGVNNKKSDNG